MCVCVCVCVSVLEYTIQSNYCSAEMMRTILLNFNCDMYMHVPSLYVHRSGFITEESIRGVCRDLGTPISEPEISHLMAE